MTDQLELLTRLETYVGAAFVAFYGFERFRKPPSEPGARQAAYPSRATTTAASYYTAVFLYCGIGVVLYGTLLFSPSVLEKIWALVPQLGDEVPSALRQSPVRGGGPPAHRAAVQGAGAGRAGRFRPHPAPAHGGHPA